ILKSILKAAACLTRLVRPCRTAEGGVPRGCPRAPLSVSRRLSRFGFHFTGGPSSEACRDLRAPRCVRLPTSSDGSASNAIRGRGRAGRGHTLSRRQWSSTRERSPVTRLPCREQVPRPPPRGSLFRCQVLAA